MLRPPVRAWLAWLAVAYTLMSAAGLASVDPWRIGAYERAVAILHPHGWAVVWAALAATAVCAVVARRMWAARAALVGSIAAQLPWAASVFLEGILQGRPWAFAPAAIVWLSIGAGSAAMLSQSLNIPQWPTVGGE